MMSGTVSSSAKRLVTTPAGKPDRTKSSSMNCAHPGTFGACFTNTTLPVIRLGATKRKTCQSGKFQGMT
jgi:hypothetical protein